MGGLTVTKKSIKIVSDPHEFLTKSFKHSGEYLIKVNGKKLWAHPEVLSPKYSYSSRFFMKHWDIGKGMKVLDMGTGSSILAIFAAHKGASKVVAVDINPFACGITKKNVEMHKLEKKIEVINSDLFKNKKLNGHTFDRILFNLPYWDKPVDLKHPLTFALNDEGYKTAIQFLAKAKKYLRKNGKVLVSFSTQGNVAFLEKQIRKNKYTIEKKFEEAKGHTRLMYFLLKV